MDTISLRSGLREYEDNVERKAAWSVSEGFYSPEEQEDVRCTYCIHSHVPAEKTCTTCDASLCRKHLLVHINSPEHVLIKPTSSLHSRKCPVHGDLLSYYCLEDASIICSKCFLVGPHKGHLVETLHMASEKKKDRVEHVLRRRSSRKERTQKRIERLQEQISSVEEKANVITCNITSLFTDIMEHLTALQERMLKGVSEQKLEVIKTISKQIQEQEIKLQVLSEQISYAENLCKITDPLTVMQMKKFGNSTTSLAQEAIRRATEETEMQDLDDVLISMTVLRNMTKIVNNVSRRREFFVPDSSDVSLNANTAGDFVFILGDKKSACRSNVNLLRQEMPEKFYCSQALSNESFSSGQHAWEVEASAFGEWMIGVTYPSIGRTGPLSYLGINDKSWCLQKCNLSYSVRHNTTENLIDVDSSCQKFLIYLDYELGRLSFYQLSDPISHLYTYKTNFTEPLHAAIMVEEDAWVRIRS